MARQAVPSIVLSVLIVCFFAVALYQPDPPAAGHGQRPWFTGKGFTRSSSARPESDRAPGSRTTAEPRGRESARVAASEATSMPPAPGPALPANRSRPYASASARPPTARAGITTAAVKKAARTNRPIAPRASFTVVQAGETLDDVARRVYGSAGLAGFLWRANRDTLDRQDAPLPPGALLRTPSPQNGKDEG